MRHRSDFLALPYISQPVPIADSRLSTATTAHHTATCCDDHCHLDLISLRFSSLFISHRVPSSLTVDNNPCPRRRSRRRRRHDKIKLCNIPDNLPYPPTLLLPISAQSVRANSSACPATCFFLGILFTNWTYDHHTLWNSVAATENIYAAVEQHYTMLARAPPILPRLLHAIIFTGLLGFLAKLWKPSESNVLFDGSSLVLYMAGVIMYGTNVIRGLRTVESGEYGEEIGRVDTMRVMAASQVILALVLVGVLALQSGQWYAERKEAQEVARAEQQRDGEERRKDKAKKRN